MSFLFGKKKKTPQEMMREYKRTIDRSCRDLDRERTTLQTREKKILEDIKKTAKANEMDAVKIMARDLVRTRQYIKKFYQMRCQLQAVGLRLETMKATSAMTDAMKGATKAMMSMNASIKIEGMQKIMMEFEKQSSIMEMKQDMMNDAVDDAMEDDEGAEEEIVNQVLDEIGIQFDAAVPGVGVGGAAPQAAAAAAPQPVAAADGGLDADLEARLAKLRQG